ncbi:MAG: PD-(D/E)XK nuclease family protein [Spirochaetes bacterium]|nr:PD-(D/E)XK nuclease family protein [Spirochaetota bacterium]
MSGTAYSHSRVGLFDQCPLAYRYRYLDGIADAFTTIEQHLGQVVHDVLEQAYAERSRGQAVDAGWLTAAFERLWHSPELATHRVVKRGVTPDEYRAQGLAMVGSFHDRVFAADDSETVYLERRFSLALDGAGSPVWAGVIDRLARLADGTLRLIDYKTGRSVPDPRTDRQLQSYALHVLAEQRVGQVELCYEGLRGGTSLTAPFPASQAGEVRGHLLARIAAIEAASSWPARPSILCNWCGFNPICPEAGGMKRLPRSRR